MSSFSVYLLTALLALPGTAVLLRAQTSTQHVTLSDDVGFSDEVQQHVKKALSSSSKADIYVFEKSGKETESFKLNPNEVMAAQKNPSLFLDSSASPIKTCKKPTPTPPPGCVVCSSGDIICSKAFQNPKKNNPHVPNGLELKP